MTHDLFESFNGYLRKSERVLLVLPRKASLDAWCGMLATKWYLESQDKEVLAVCEDPVPHQLEFLELKNAVVTDVLPDGDFVISLRTDRTDVERIKYTKGDHHLDILITPKDGAFDKEDVSFRQSVGRFDLIVGFDIAGLEHLGTVFTENPSLFSNVPLVNVSIHPAHDQVGKLNLCYPEKSSICEIIHEYLHYERVERYDEILSTILLTGVLASTESFLNNHTTPSGFDMASMLQSFGARQSDIIEHVFKQKSLTTLKLWGEVLQSMSFDPEYKVVWSRITASHFERFGAQMSHLDDMARTILRFTGDSDVALLCVEYEGQIIAQLRSRKASYDFDFVRDLEDVEVQVCDGGVDVIFEKKSLGKVESLMLKILGERQKQRLRLSGDKEIEAMDYRVKPETTRTSYPKMKASKAKVMAGALAHAPEEVPFEVKGVKIIRENEQPAASNQQPALNTPEEPVSSALDKNIPGWLK